MLVLEALGARSVRLAFGCRRQAFDYHGPALDALGGDRLARAVADVATTRGGLINRAFAALYGRLGIP